MNPSRDWVRRISAIWMAVWLFGCMAFQYHPRSIQGAHCPTAPVQKTMVAIRNCCGKVIGFKEHTPQTGEASFVQCRCAEKRSAESGIRIPPKLEPFFLPSGQLVVPPTIRVAFVTPEPEFREVERLAPPRVPPPNLA